MKKKAWLWNHYATDMNKNKGGRHYWFAENLIKEEYEATVFCANTYHNKSEFIDTGKKKYATDIFKVDGEYYISEVNPRFGGGYPHGYECGMNIPGMIIKNIDGDINEEALGAYDEGVYMMKYNEVMVRR